MALPGLPGSALRALSLPAGARASVCLSVSWLSGSSKAALVKEADGAGSVLSDRGSLPCLQGAFEEATLFAGRGLGCLCPGDPLMGFPSPAVLLPCCLSPCFCLGALNERSSAWPVSLLPLHGRCQAPRWRRHGEDEPRGAREGGGQAAAPLLPSRALLGLSRW